MVVSIWAMYIPLAYRGSATHRFVTNPEFRMLVEGQGLRGDLETQRAGYLRLRSFGWGRPATFQVIDQACLAEERCYQNHQILVCGSGCLQRSR